MTKIADLFFKFVKIFFMMLDQFDKSKPYYGFVYQYFVNFYGSIVLWNKYFLRGLSKFELEFREKGLWELHIDQMDLEEGERDYLKAGIPEYPRLLFPPNLVNSFNKDTILINDENMLDRGGDNTSRINALSKMSNMLIVMAFEILPSAIKYDKTDVLINFLFHCRNAAAHGGAFNITSRTRFPAKWRSMSVSLNDNGKNLVVDTGGVGVLKPMDIVLLLLDVERKYYDLIK